MEKPTLKTFAEALGVLALAVSLSTFALSCKTRTLAVDRIIKVPYMLHDTVIKRPKQPTEAERLDMVDKFYKYGYDKYYGPQFDRLSAVIKDQAISNSKQAASIQRLTDMIESIRMRSIRKTDSMRQVDNLKTAQLLEYQKGTYLRQQEAVKQNKLQIGDLNSLIRILLIGGGGLWICMLGLFIYNKIQFKRITKLYKSIAND